MWGKAEEHHRKQFDARMTEFKEKYDKDLNCVRTQYYDLRISMIEKDRLIMKLCEMLRQQEKLLSHVKHVLKINNLGNIDLEKVSKPKTEKEENQEIGMLKVRVTNLTFNYNCLKENFENLEQINIKTTDDWSKAEHKVKELKTALEESEQKHKEEVQKLKDDFKLRELKLLSEKDNLTSNYVRYQDDLNKELKIREELVSRYQKYSDTLEKKLVVCK